MGTRDHVGRGRSPGRGADVPSSPGHASRAPRTQEARAGRAAGVTGRSSTDRRAGLGPNGARELTEAAGGLQRTETAPGSRAAGSPRVELDARIFLALGATGTGKSATLKLELAAIAAAPRRPWGILVDPDNEYGAHVAALSADLNTITSISLKPGTGAGWFRFVPSDDRKLAIRQFSYLCGLAWIWSTRLKRETLLLVDELSDFTAANDAPAAWRRLVRRGRKQGISVLAASQRPAEIDKTIFSNASRIRVYRLGYDADQTAAAAALGVARTDVAGLQGHEFLERNALAGGGLTRGTLHFTT